MRWLTLAVWGVAAMATTTGCSRTKTPPAAEPNILVGPRFWTGDAAHPWADALVLSEGRIVALASKAEIPKLIAGGGSVRELPGVVAVPGLVDAHGHLAGYALARRRVDLAGTTSVEQALDRVEKFAAAHPDDRWVQGRGWDQNEWPDHAWPDADRLEQIVPGRPCALWRVDGHALWVNRTALAAAGIGPATKDPSGGTIHRDSDGRPTGILVDNAAELVAAKIPAPSAKELRAALEAAAPELTSLGLTGVHAMDVDGKEWDALEALAREGRFPLRVTAYAKLESDLHRRLLAQGPLVSGRLRAAGVKLYADGALGSRGARLLAPYDDARGVKGLWIVPPKKLEEQVAAVLAARLQPAVHAIGDAANREVLDAFAAAERRDPAARDLRPRVEHAQILDRADVPRFARLGAIASMQPTHATSDMPWVEDRLGSARLAGAYAWRSLASSGARLASGSDFPIESPDPRLGLYAATTRQDLRGAPSGGWLPAQRLTLVEALAAFTQGAAYAGRDEENVGQLTPGKWCDVTVFGIDIFRAPPREIAEAPIAATVIGGQVFFRQAAPKR